MTTTLDMGRRNAPASARIPSAATERVRRASQVPPRVDCGTVSGQRWKSDVGRHSRDVVAEARAWKLFAVVPIMLLSRPRGIGRIGRDELASRADQFARGD